MNFGHLKSLLPGQESVVGDDPVAEKSSVICGRQSTSSSPVSSASSLMMISVLTRSPGSIIVSADSVKQCEAVSAVVVNQRQLTGLSLSELAHT